MPDLLQPLRHVSKIHSRLICEYSRGFQRAAQLANRRCIVAEGFRAGIQLVVKFLAENSAGHGLAAERILQGGIDRENIRDKVLQANRNLFNRRRKCDSQFSAKRSDGDLRPANGIIRRLDIRRVCV